MAVYKNNRALVRKRHLQRVLIALIAPAAWIVCLGTIDGLYESVYPVPASIQISFFIVNIFIITMCIILQLRTIQRIETCDGLISITNRQRATNVIPYTDIAYIYVKRSRGEIKRIHLVDSLNHTLAKLPLRTASQHIDGANDLYAELENIVGPDEVTSM